VKNFFLKNYECRVGVVFLGGCGEGIARRIVDRYDPRRYPGFSLFVANTDLATLCFHFGNEEDPQQKLWQEANALTPHQLGGAEVTDGRGAGAKPDIGRLAAETEASKKELTKFLEPLNEVIIVTGEGGGTGDGAAPVVAELAKKMGKTVIAVAVMPEPSENRTERAVAGLKRLRALVPTVAISNAYLAEYLDSLPEDEADRITDREAWNIVDEHSTLPLIEILRAIFQTPGDLVNTDEADWETMLECGSHLGFGLVSVKDREEALKLGADKIVEELFKGRFQDTKIFERAKVAALWRQGEWPKRLATKVEELVRAHVSKGATHDNPVEIHRGIASGARDEKMWIAIIVVADEEGAESQASVSLQPAATIKVPFSFLSDGERFDTKAPIELVEAFDKRVRGKMGVSRSVYEPIFDKVEAATGRRPDHSNVYHKQNASVSSHNDNAASDQVSVSAVEKQADELSLPSQASAPVEQILDEAPVSTLLPSFLRRRVSVILGGNGNHGNPPAAK
jgi:cell division GTPase FtsZ